MGDQQKQDGSAERYARAARQDAQRTDLKRWSMGFRASFYQERAHKARVSPEWNRPQAP